MQGQNTRKNKEKQGGAGYFPYPPRRLAGYAAIWLSATVLCLLKSNGLWLPHTIFIDEISVRWIAIFDPANNTADTRCQNMSWGVRFCHIWQIDFALLFSYNRVVTIQYLHSYGQKSIPDQLRWWDFCFLAYVFLRSAQHVRRPTESLHENKH